MPDRPNLNMIFDPETAIARGESAYLKPRAPRSEEEFVNLIRQLTKEELDCLIDLMLERGLIPTRLDGVAS